MDHTGTEISAPSQPVSGSSSLACIFSVPVPPYIGRWSISAEVGPHEARASGCSEVRVSVSVSRRAFPPAERPNGRQTTILVPANITSESLLRTSRSCQINPLAGCILHSLTVSGCRCHYAPSSSVCPNPCVLIISVTEICFIRCFLGLPACLPTCPVVWLIYPAVIYEPTRPRIV